MIVKKVYRYDVHGRAILKTLKGYTVKVHALKSSARIIGAGKLSKLAGELEEAGKKEDMDFIGEHMEELLSMYRELDRDLAEL